ncbi:MAG: aminotransferase class V-fold PLP-dependent enzyme [Chloroflexia bacterium]|nr:aminotransferase class V-fold PLP-dependent enzyme [Chloroflexia bacterium]
MRTIINGRGATTAVGGTLMPPEVVAAMTGAAGAYVVLDELNAAVGRRIATVTGAEAGCVVNGSAAGMALSAAACIAGGDPARIRRLPDSDGLANEIIIHRCQRINYDLMFRLGGGQLVEIGRPLGTEPWELDAAINPRTAAVAWIDSPATTPGASDFDAVVSAAHAHKLPVIVDAASTLPPVQHLRRWIDRGADLVIYSGGKGIRGPQDSGLVAGRHDLIAAVRANSNPYAGIGRGMKVSKEAMAGLWVALDLFLRTDHEAEYRAHLGQAETMVAGLRDRADLSCVLESNWEDWPAPVVRLFPIQGAWQPEEVRDALAAGEPSIQLNVERSGLMINTHCLQPGEEAIVVNRLSMILDAAASA